MFSSVATDFGPSTTKYKENLLISSDFVFTHTELLYLTFFRRFGKNVFLIQWKIK